MSIVIYKYVFACIYSYKFKSYTLHYNPNVEIKDWKYVVLDSEEIQGSQDKSIDTVIFNLDFKENEEYKVEISYSYRLGGNPTDHLEGNRGYIYYYLRPASMWENFSDITINLHLSKEMPAIKNSSLEFKKVGKRDYQYKSDNLPDKDLEIEVGSGWFWSIIEYVIELFIRIIAIIVISFIVITLIRPDIGIIIFFVILIISSIYLYIYKKKK